MLVSEMPVADIEFYLGLMDPVERNIMGDPHPFPVKKSGVYYCYVDGCNGEIPLYVGRSVDLRIRLWQHWRGGQYSNWVEKHLDWWNDEFDKSNFCPQCLSHPRLNGKCANVTIISRAWFIDCEDSRTWFEHELIAKLRPIYNKA